MQNCDLEGILAKVNEGHEALKRISKKRFKLFYNSKIIDYLVFLNGIQSEIEDIREIDSLPEPERSLKTEAYLTVYHCKSYWRSELYQRGYFKKLIFD